MPTYSCTGADLTNAFDHIHHFLEVDKVTSTNKKLFTLCGALNFAVGHNKNVLLVARNIVNSRLEYKGASQWLIDNGVPETELRGLRGFRNLRVWRALWAKKLADEFNQDPYLIHTLEYPF